ncbi:MAG: acyl carrier protein [Alphaproteobacteria bacterium]
MIENIDKACRLVAEALGVSLGEITSKSSIETIEAWDSLGHMRVVAAVEEILQRELEPEKLVAITSVTDIASLLGSQ